MQPQSIFFVGEMIHTPWMDPRFLKHAGLRIVKTPQEADYFVARERRCYTKAQLAMKKPNIIWTHEPFLEKANSFVVEDNGALFFIFNMYLSNIYVDNFFYAPGSNIEYVTSDTLNTDFTNKKAGILSTRRNTRRLVGGVDYSLDNIRSDLALDLHYLGMADIMGRAWPDGVPVGNTREGDWGNSKQDFLKGYNFSLCMENTCFRGYTSEKLWQCLEGHCMPIYYNNGSIYDTFPTDSFIDFKTLSDAGELAQLMQEMSLETYLERINKCIKVYNDAVDNKQGAASKQLTWDTIIRHLPMIQFAAHSYKLGLPADYDGGKPVDPDGQKDEDEIKIPTDGVNLLSNSDFAAWPNGTNVSIGEDHKYPAEHWNAFRDGYKSGLKLAQVPGPDGKSFAMRVQLEAGNEHSQGATVAQDLPTKLSRPLAGSRVALQFKYRCGAGFSAASGLNALLTASQGQDTPSRSAPPDRFADAVRDLTSTDWDEATLTMEVPRDKTQLHVAFYWVPNDDIGDDHWIEINDVRLTALKAEKKRPSSKSKSRHLGKNRPLVVGAPMPEHIKSAGKMIERDQQKEVWLRLSRMLENYDGDLSNLKGLAYKLPVLYHALSAHPYRDIKLSKKLNKLTSVTQTVLAAKNQIKDIKDHRYFGDQLNNYTNGGGLFDMFAQGDVKREDFALYPPNLLVLQMLLEAKIKPKTFVDFACGLGNMNSYLRKIAPDTKYIGIDNFEQISRRLVAQFQALTDKATISAKVTEGENVDWVSCIGLPIIYVVDDILKLKPKLCLFESYWYDEDLPFDIISWNEILIVAKPRSA